MITLTPDGVKKCFAPLRSRKYLVMIDESAGLAEIIEQYRARGTIEWDAMNRCRAGGVVTGCSVEGNAMTLRARIGTVLRGNKGIEAAGLYGEHL